MKLQGLLSDPYIDLRSGWSRGVLGMTVSIEAFIAMFVLINRSVVLVSITIVSLFGTFAVVQTLRWLSGHEDCGWFGRQTLSPIWVLSFDLGVVIAAVAILLLYQKESLNSLVWPSSLIEYSIPFVSVAIAGAIGFVLFDPLIDDRLQTIFSGPAPISVPSVELPTMKTSEQRLVSLAMINRSDQPIGTAGIESSCQCLAVDELPEVIPAGKTHTMTVRVRPGESGWYRQQLRIFLRCERQPYVVAEFSGFVE